MNTTIRSFARDLVYHYSKLDKVSGCYTLTQSDIPEFDLYELSALIIKQDKDYALEATSVDNPEYLKSMLPALTKYLSNSTDKAIQYDFNQTWVKGIYSYLKRAIGNLLSDMLDEYNDDKGYVHIPEAKREGYRSVA